MDIENTPFRPVSYMPREIEVERRPDGAVRMRSRLKLGEVPSHLPELLARHARHRPASPWLAQRRGAQREWSILTFGEAKVLVDSLTQGLIQQSSGARRPLAILSGNSIEHALITLAAMQAGMPVVPVSPAYSLLSGDYIKLKGVVELVQPGFIFVQNGKQFEKALSALDLQGVKVLQVENCAARDGWLAYDSLLNCSPGPEVERAIATIDPDAVAKLMFTSGSTGLPKAVMQTHRALCSVLVSAMQTFGYSEQKPMVKLDWTPWNHVFGATNMGLTLAAGGTFYIDEGRPVPGQLEETIRNLREISTTDYGSVPAGFAAIISSLEADEAMAKTFFADLETLSYAGARLSDDVALRLQQVAIKTTGHRVPITTGFGATETGPSGAFVYWPTDKVGFIGLPQPGIEMKLLPLDSERYELRIRGAMVTSGYFRDPERTAEAFDEDGYYRTGDAARFVDSQDPLQGLVFAGRTSEDFKLQTGTFVHSITVRTGVLNHLAPLAQDVVICGEDKAFVGALIWLKLEVCRDIAGDANLSLSDLAKHPKVITQIKQAMNGYNQVFSASSTRIGRVALLNESPSLECGEITDKGALSQRVLLRVRAELVDALYAGARAPEIIDLLQPH